MEDRRAQPSEISPSRFNQSSGVVHRVQNTLSERSAKEIRVKTRVEVDNPTGQRIESRE